MLDELIKELDETKKEVKNRFCKKNSLTNLSKLEIKLDNVTSKIDETFDSLTNKKDEKKFYELVDLLKELLENLSYLRAKVRLSK
jgi:hypothetical protein